MLPMRMYETLIVIVAEESESKRQEKIYMKIGLANIRDKDNYSCIWEL